METVGFASVKRARFVGRHREIEARGIRKRGRHAARRGAAAWRVYEPRMTTDNG